MMKDLEFVTSDFTAAPTGRASEMANWVNAKLKRKLDKAKKFDLTIDEYGLRQWRDSGITGTCSPTHTARLVCIEEIPKEEE